MRCAIGRPWFPTGGYHGFTGRIDVNHTWSFNKIAGVLRDLTTVHVIRLVCYYDLDLKKMIVIDSRGDGTSFFLVKRIRCVCVYTCICRGTFITSVTYELWFKIVPEGRAIAQNDLMKR